jgi:hypothetical protein
MQRSDGKQYKSAYYTSLRHRRNDTKLIYYVNTDRLSLCQAERFRACVLSAKLWLDFVPSARFVEQAKGYYAWVRSTVNYSRDNTYLCVQKAEFAHAWVQEREFFSSGGQASVVLNCKLSARRLFITTTGTKLMKVVRVTNCWLQNARDDERGKKLKFKSLLFKKINI